MWKSSAPTTPWTLAREFIAITLGMLVVWLITGGPFRLLVAYVVIYLVAIILRALNIRTGDRPDRAAVAEMIRQRRGRRSS